MMGSMLSMIDSGPQEPFEPINNRLIKTRERSLGVSYSCLKGMVDGVFLTFNHLMKGMKEHALVLVLSLGK
jgi:hypothetical protein